MKENAGEPAKVMEDRRRWRVAMADQGKIEENNRQAESMPQRSRPEPIASEMPPAGKQPGDSNMCLHTRYVHLYYHNIIRHCVNPYDCYADHVVHMSVCLSACLSVSLCICICVYIYIYIHTCGHGVCRGLKPAVSWYALKPV